MRFMCHKRSSLPTPGPLLNNEVYELLGHCIFGEQLYPTRRLVCTARFLPHPISCHTEIA